MPGNDSKTSSASPSPMKNVPSPVERPSSPRLDSTTGSVGGVHRGATRGVQPTRLMGSTTGSIPARNERCEQLSVTGGNSGNAPARGSGTPIRAPKGAENKKG